MAGGLGVEIEDDYAFGRGAAFFFGEDQASYIIETDRADIEGLVGQAKCANVGIFHLGFVGGDSIKLKDPQIAAGRGFEVTIADLRAAHEGFFPRLMGSALTPEF